MKRLIVRLSLACIFLTGTALAAGPWVSLSDGVAGQDFPVRVSGLLAAENLSTVLVRPDDSKISLNTVADELGVASFLVNGLHVREAGEYELFIRREFSSNVVAENFLVSPAMVSAYRSDISIDVPAVAADGEQVSRIRVRVKDAHGNLISKAPIRAFSSRVEDLVVVAPRSDAGGEAVVKVSSTTPGVSSISVLVGDILLHQRAELVFHLSNISKSNVGASGIWNDLGKSAQASLFEDIEEPTDIAYFSIEDIGAEVIAGKNLTVRVGAKDANGDVVLNYTGTVRFSSSDDRAVRPNDYAFTPEDQGWHTFYLSVMFQTPGMQSLAVNDLDDFRISGERTITVADDGSVVVAPDATPEVKITVPVNGAVFSTSRITISGTTVGCSLVRLADGPIELIAELPVDASGTYVYQTPGLADGMHIFQATCVDNPAVISNQVQITIDRSPPQVMLAEFVPAGDALPGAEVTLKIGASDELSSVSCVFNGKLHDLVAEDSRNFAGPIRAPMEVGEYPVECTIADLLGNKMTEPNTGVLVVALAKEEPKENIAPLPVSDVQTRPGERLVTVLWSPAVDDDGIKNYRLNYGACGEELTGVDMTPDARTQWYVEGLEPCVERCFQVTPFDSKDLEGAPSEIVPGTPFCEEVEHPAPPKTGANTPSWLIIFSIIAGIGAVLLLRRRA